MSVAGFTIKGDIFDLRVGRKARARYIAPDEVMCMSPRARGERRLSQPNQESQEPSPVLPELLELRASIDNIDAALIHLLAERFKCTQRVGRLKAEHDLPPADPRREAVQIRRLRQMAAEARLDPEFAEKFLNFVIKEVIRHHLSARQSHNDQ
jgi:chorismate mutase